jgi:hypothetical protein
VGPNISIILHKGPGADSGRAEAAREWGTRFNQEQGRVLLVTRCAAHRESGVEVHEIVSQFL